MKLYLANKRSKQGSKLSQPELIGAIAKHNFAKSDHSAYMPDEKIEFETKQPTSNNTKVAQEPTIEAEIVKPNEPVIRTPYQLRLTKRCLNCGELISKTDYLCWHCKMPTTEHPSYRRELNQTIIIKERRAGGCLSCLLIAVLLLIALPFILYLLGLVSIGWWWSKFLSL